MAFWLLINPDCLIVLLITSPSVKRPGAIILIVSIQTCIAECLPDVRHDHHGSNVLVAVRIRPILHWQDVSDSILINVERLEEVWSACSEMQRSFF